jgi:hypothetical protein
MPSHLRMTAAAGLALAALSVAYAAVLAIGLVTLASPDQPIQNPWFTVMEVLILAIAPAMVAFTVGLCAWATAERKALAMLSVVFMSMCAGVTCGVHFAVLTLSRHPAFAGPDWATLVFSFRWPSLVYALDILAWDLFFPLAAMFAALAVHGSGLAGLVRALLFASAALAFIGLAGVPLANMNIRNIGIVGYVFLFPAAALLLALMVRRQVAHSAA